MLAIGLSVVVAVAQGFLLEMFSLAGAVLGYVIAIWNYGRVAPRLLPYVKDAWMADLVAFLLIFFFVLVLAGIAGKLARWGFKEAGLQWFDRLLGGAFGLVRGAIIATVVVVALATFSPRSPAVAESSLGPYFLVLGRAAVVAAPWVVRTRFREGVLAIRDLKPPAPTGSARQQNEQESIKQ